jgi:hypothetical protein
MEGKRRSHINMSAQEEKMRHLFKVNGILATLVATLLLLLGGCGQPLINVDVKVDTCQTGGMGKSIGELPPPGGCNPPQAYSGSADYFYNWVTKAQIPGGSGLVCSAAGSTRCNTTLGPGRCTSGTCKNWYNPTTHYCNCGCP